MSVEAARITTGCAFCGLPLPHRRESRTDQLRYCCYGCRFAAAASGTSGAEGWNIATLARLGLAIFFTLNVVMFTMVLWSPEIYGASDDSEFSRILQSLLRYLSALMALPVLWLLGFPLLENAWATLRTQRNLSMDWLIVAGVAAAYVYSLHSTWTESGPIYFEVGCVVLVLVTLGRWLEATGKQKTLAELAVLEHWLPATVRLVVDDRTTELPAAAVEAGMLLRVLPGERAPTDGYVEMQSVNMDEQWLTGESQPRLKEPGAPIFGGTLATDGVLYLRTSAKVGEGTLERFLGLVRASLQAKGRYERLADRLTQFFLPLVMLVAVAATAWHGWQEGLQTGIMVGLGVVLIACPCALGIATPLATWTALGEAARRQVLITQPTALEQLPDVERLYFDKTGTLTSGRPRLAETTWAADSDPSKLWALVAQLGAQSRHPLAQALVAGAARTSGAAPVISDVKQVPGRGLRAFAQGTVVALGNRQWMDSLGCAWPAALAAAATAAEATDQPLVCLGVADRVEAVFQFSEDLRPEAESTLRELEAQGVRVAVLTGDHAGRAAALAQALQVPVYCDLMPEAKVEALRAAQQQQGHAVGMVGDGLNDAPALAAADVGIALGCGADLARESAAVCLLTSDLRQIPWLFGLARRTRQTIRLNLFWAFVYNVGGIGLALMGWLTPIWAALAMTLSSLFVVGNSLRLRKMDGTIPEGTSAAGITS